MGEEKTVGCATPFDGRLLRLDVVDVELPDGRRSVREIVRHRGAIGVLAERTEGEFVFVRQYRKPVEQELIEIVAGTLEAGESPEDCLARELREETGCEITESRRLGIIFPAPGYTDERLHLYYARVRPAAAGASPDEDENVEAVVLKTAEVDDLLRRGEIRDAKTLAAWLLWRMEKEGA